MVCRQQLAHLAIDSVRDSSAGIVVLILLTRPEEAAQAVFTAARNHVDVQVRDSLADVIVDGDESAFGVEGRFNGFGEQLCRGE